MQERNRLFDIEGRVAVVTGGGGVLGGNISKSLVKAGVKVAVLDIRQEQLDIRVEELRQLGGDVAGFIGNVLDKDNLEQACSKILKKWGKIDILVNAAGGNIPGATLEPEQTFFDMKMEDLNKVIDLNLNGSVLPSMVFGQSMANQGSGSIINISSMATFSAITRVPGYSIAKSGINIFTQWLASEMALKFGEGIRVNAIAPGFFIGDQNRKVLLNEDGSYTERSEKVIAKTPMRRFGKLDELNGAVQFLCSDAASFITGVIMPVDGGFSAFSGV
jgi:NAD(P)-dependent dehydrogenase (short-subunit alcohol dehydrogenase family)